MTTQRYYNTLRQEQAAKVCQWYALCTNPSMGTVTHPVLGDVPTCQRCADKHGLELVSTPSTPRPIWVIANEITRLWRRKDGSSAVWFGAVPYLRAMRSLDKITDNYGADSAWEIVIYFLANAATWRGEDARRIKAELRALADELHSPHGR